MELMFHLESTIRAPSVMLLQTVVLALLPTRCAIASYFIPSGGPA